MKLKQKIFNKVLLLSILIIYSCASKKQVLYMQDIKEIDISEVTSFQYIFRKMIF